MDQKQFLSTLGKNQSWSHGNWDDQSIPELEERFGGYAIALLVNNLDCDVFEQVVGYRICKSSERLNARLLGPLQCRNTTRTFVSDVLKQAQHCCSEWRWRSPGRRASFSGDAQPLLSYRRPKYPTHRENARGTPSHRTHHCRMRR